jgi:uncharacterized protein DUF6970
MKTFLITITCLIILNSCQKKSSTGSIPSCIQAKINELKSKPKYDPPAKVIQYEYNGKTVYYITSDCCDQYNMLYEDDCKYICAPDGGITGAGDGKCSDFHTKKTNEKIIWQDTR